MSVAVVSDEDLQFVRALQRFEDARHSLRSYTASKEELLWRMTHRFPPSHKARKAVERLLFGGLDSFQARADDCACDYAARLPGRAFPGYETPIDVFYGSSQIVPSRVEEWQALEERARYGCHLTPLDLELLDQAGSHASSFMREVRALPYFQSRWNGKQPRREGFVVNTDSLNDCEAKFINNYAAAHQLFCAQPLVTEFEDHVD